MASLILDPRAVRELDAASLARREPPAAMSTAVLTEIRPPPRVLVVDFRDEVYAALRRMLTQEGFNVFRIESEAAVPGGINRLQPDLVLIAAEMPYESGWLVACKLKFSHPRHTVWLYGGRDTDQIPQRQRVCGVQEFMPYGGVLLQLIDQLRQAVRQWMQVCSQGGVT